MKRILTTVAALFGVVACGAGAQAVTLFQSDPDQSSATGFADFSATDSTAIGALTVSQSETIGAIGVLNNLPDGASLKFLIADANTGTLLYVSGAQYFAAETGGDLNLTYKVSSGLSFTFLPGTTYLVGSIADGATFTFLDFSQTNTANGFTSLLGNESVSDFASPTIDTSQNCCSVGFELLDAPLAISEPGALALLGVGLVGTALLRRRPWQSVASEAAGEA